MYRGKEPQKKTRKRGKVADFFMKAVSGRHLLLSWRRWAGWLVVGTIISIIFIYNERAIDEKRAYIKKLEKKQSSNVEQLKNVNDIVLTNEQKEREKARKDGFVDVREYDYYIIKKNK
jgi:hypothetical protein